VGREKRERRCAGRFRFSEQKSGRGANVALRRLVSQLLQLGKRGGSNTERGMGGGRGKDFEHGDLGLLRRYVSKSGFKATLFQA